MKKIIASILLTIATLFASIVPLYAADVEEFSQPKCVQTKTDGSTTIYYEDGSILFISPVKNIRNGVDLSRSSVETTSGSREAYFTDGSGNLEWEYTLSASFSFIRGKSAYCSNASYSNSTYDSSWTFSDGSATESGSTAYGKGKYVKHILGMTVNTYNIDLSISCDVYGNLS